MASTVQVEIGAKGFQKQISKMGRDMLFGIILTPGIMMNFPLFCSLGHGSLNMESASPAFNTPHWTSDGRFSAERPDIGKLDDGLFSSCQTRALGSK